MRILIAALLIAIAGPARADGIWKLPPTVAVKDVTATSTFADKRDAYAAWRALAYEERSNMVHPEPVLWTAWCEGKKDEGIGERLTITLAEPTAIDRVRIAAGVWRTDRLFAANNRITAMTVLVDGKPQVVKPAGKRWSEIKIVGKVSTLSFQIDRVKKGRMNDSCIAGIDLMRGGRRLAPVIGVDARAAAALQPMVESTQRALAASDRAGLRALIAFPFGNYNADMDMGYGGGETMITGDWKELVAACAALDKHREDSDGDPINTACPSPVDYDPDDDRSPGVETVTPGTVEITWPSGREVVVTWELRWTDRWRLESIGADAM